MYWPRSPTCGAPGRARSRAAPPCSWILTLRTCCNATTLAVVLSACSSSARPGNIHPAGVLSPENRVVMSDFSVIEAVAASSWFVYAASTHGLLIYDRVSRRFRNPVTAIDGYPALRVRRAIADPTANAVWLDLGAGAGYLRYDVDGRAWTPGTPASTTGTLTVEAALASAPLADAMRAAILTDQRL